MFRKSVVSFCVAALALSGASLIAQSVVDGDAEQMKKIKMKDDPVNRSGPMTRVLPAPVRTALAGPPPAKGGPVAVVYDDGIVTAVPDSGSTGFCVGNQFNTAYGARIRTYSVTMLTFFIATGAGTDGVFVSLYGAVSGTMAPFIEDILIPTVNSGGFNTVTIGPYGGAGSFLAGVWYVADDTVGLGSGTVGGQGHHGMVINDIDGTGFATLPGLNALVRAKYVVIPVELMDFTVTDH